MICRGVKSNNKKKNNKTCTGGPVAGGVTTIVLGEILYGVIISFLIQEKLLEKN